MVTWQENMKSQAIASRNLAHSIHPLLLMPGLAQVIGMLKDCTSLTALQAASVIVHLH